LVCCCLYSLQFRDCCCCYCFFPQTIIHHIDLLIWMSIYDVIDKSMTCHLVMSLVSPWPIRMIHGMNESSYLCTRLYHNSNQSQPVWVSLSLWHIRYLYPFRLLLGNTTYYSVCSLLLWKKFHDFNMNNLLFKHFSWNFRKISSRNCLVYFYFLAENSQDSQH